MISLLIGGKPKAKKAAKQNLEDASENLVIIGAVLVAEIINDMATEQDGFWQWYVKFYNALDRQAKLTWGDLTQFLLEESLPLYLAQQLADTPEEAARLRTHFSAESWQ